MNTVYVTTILCQEIQVPEEYNEQDIYNFLAEHQSFRDAFCKTSDESFKITDIQVVTESINE
jgi:hypothetical protein